MSLLDRFRPKWQHSDTDVRAAAVRQLGKEDSELLGAVAQGDPDPRVRRIAVKKLDNPKLLLEISREDDDDSLRGFAKERANAILVDIAVSDEDTDQSERAVALLEDPKQLATVIKTANLDAIRRVALERLTDAKSLAEIVGSAGDLSLRKDALTRIEDPATLRIIAESETGELATSAVEKILDPDTLLAITEDKSAHKNARRLAEAKLQETIGDDHPIRIKQRQATQEEICREVEALTEETNLDRAVESVLGAKARWEELTGKGDVEETIAQRFQTACDSVLERKARLESRRAEQEQILKQQEESLATRVAICERVERLESSQEMLAVVEKAQADWRELGEVADESIQPLVQRFRAACDRAQARHGSWMEWLEQRSQLELLIQEAQKLVRLASAEASNRWAELEKRWARLAATVHPDNDQEEDLSKLAEDFAAAKEKIAERKEREREKKKARQQETLDHARRLCEHMDGLSDKEELVLKDAFKEMRDAQTFLRDMGPLPPSENRKKWRTKLADSRQKLHLRVQEYRETDEWRRWANVDLQEKLIHRMEALQETKDLREAAKQLREIQLEWKQFSAVPKAQSETLWQRFKKARDEVRKRCDSFFDTLDKERAENLDKKKALCEKVETLVESTNWENTAEQIKQLQQEWKKVGAVPQKESDVVWKRFRKACDKFFDGRKDHYNELKKEREENFKAKNELCEKAEAIADSTEWRATADELKRLQLEWKKIGPVPRKKSDAVWKRFRKACDHFFERFKRRDEVELTENLDQKASLCKELESLLSVGEGDDPPGPETIVAKTREAWSSWSRVGQVPKDQEESIESRFRTVVERIVSNEAHDFGGTELDPAANRKKKQRICERLEQLVDSATKADSSSSSSLDDLAERLKNALAARTIGGDASREKEINWRDATQQARRLKDNWERLGPLPGTKGEALEGRFHDAYKKFFHLRSAQNRKPGVGQASPGKSKQAIQRKRTGSEPGKKSAAGKRQSEETEQVGGEQNEQSAASSQKSEEADQAGSEQDGQSAVSSQKSEETEQASGEQNEHLAADNQKSEETEQTGSEPDEPSAPSSQQSEETDQAGSEQDEQSAAGSRQLEETEQAGSEPDEHLAADNQKSEETEQTGSEPDEPSAPSSQQSEETDQAGSEPDKPPAVSSQPASAEASASANATADETADETADPPKP